MPPLRVWFFTPAFPPFPGGGERYAESLAHHLLPLGCHITVLTSAASAERDFWRGQAHAAADTPQTGLQIRRVPLAPFPGGRRALLLWRKAMVLLSALPGDQSALLARMARRIPALPALAAATHDLPTPELIHGFNISWEHALLTGAAVAQQRGVPFVATPFAHFGAAARDRVARNSMMDHQRRALAQADAVLVLTSVEAAGLAAWGVAPAQVAVIDGGARPVPPLPPRNSLLARFALPDPPFMLFVGRHTFEKGAVHAGQAALKSGVPLVTVGADSAEFNRFYARLSTSERQLVRPLGLVTDLEKHALLAAALGLMLPSRTDSFGLVFLEAWSHGKPVIGANAGGIPGVVTDGQDGLLVPFGDVPALARAMRRLAEDAALAQRLGAAGQAQVATRFNWDTVAARVKAVYDRVSGRGFA